MFVWKNNQSTKIAMIATIMQTATINFSINLFTNIVRKKNQEATENVITESVITEHTLLTDMILKTARVIYL